MVNVACILCDQSIRLLHQILFKRVSTSSYVMNESPFEYPSFTVCINMDREITGAVGNMTWWSNEQYKKYTAFPFEPLRTVNDGFCW